MKRYLVPILVLILIGSLLGCSGTIKLSAGERDEAVAFYKALNLIYSEIMDNMGEWNEWTSSASQLEFDREIQKKCNHYEYIFTNLHNNLVNLSTPDRLVELKNTLAQATDKASDSFAMTRQYANTGEEVYFNKALQSLNQYNKLMVVAAQKWDDGLTYYNIDLSEIIP